MLGFCVSVLFDVGEWIFVEDLVYYGVCKVFEVVGLECLLVLVDE